MSWSNFSHKLRYYFQPIWLSICTDIWRKSFALLLGFICWYYIYIGFREKNNEWRTFAIVPVSLQKHPEFYLPRQENLTVELKIEVESSARKGSIAPDDFLIEINPARLKLTSLEDSNFLRRPYKVTLNVDEHIKQKPPGVKVLRFDPPEVEIYFDRRLQVQKKVYVTIQGRLREGFDYRYELSQDTVTVEGPASELANLLVIYSAPLLLNETMQHDFSTKLGVASPDSSKFNVFPDTVEVKVNIEDKKSVISQKFAAVKLALLFPSRSHLRVTNQLPDSVEVILRGQRELMNAIKPEQFTAFLDLTHLTTPGTYDELAVQFVGLPAEIKPFFIKPDKFIVTLAARMPAGGSSDAAKASTDIPGNNGN